jgi:hypothetical protein
MKPETKICQNCKQNFTIESEDFNFYEKIKVPSPTFCPECRLIRRMIWRNERTLYKRTCDKTDKQIITMFHPDANVVVYDHDAWWSDEWEPTDYGQDYDFFKPFFEQFKMLLQKTPLANLGNSNCPGSPYGNHNEDCKFCYLLYSSFNNERVHYSYGAVATKDCIDIYTGGNSELCYESTIFNGSYKTHFSYDANDSIDSVFLKHCGNVQDCIGCVNLRNKSHAIFNIQYSKEEYDTRKKVCEFKKSYNLFCLNFPNRYANIIKSVGCTGDNILNSKNSKNCFDLYGGTEDGRYLTHFVNGKDCYDIYGGGAVVSLAYEGIDTGLQSSEQLFSVLNHTCFKTQYTYMCYNSKNLFGCVGLRGKQYCILNKQYTKEEYFKLLPKIIEHMNAMSYKDKKGLIYKYGEFFPSELSPFAYNETITQEYFTKTKEEIIKQGYFYRAPSEKDYQPTVKSEDLPDHIKDISESILDEVIACPNNGDEKTQCTKAYRIIKPELDFLKNTNLALPRYCPNCRHYSRLKQRNPFHLWSRKCQCAGTHSSNKKYKNTIEHFHGAEKCEVEFETSYAPDRPEIVYCEKCYQQEVY